MHFSITQNSVFLESLKSSGHLVMWGNANTGVCWDLVALLFAFLMDLAFDGDITISIKMVGASS